MNEMTSGPHYDNQENTACGGHSVSEKTHSSKRIGGRLRRLTPILLLAMLVACTRETDSWDSDVAPAGPRALTSGSMPADQRGLQEVDRPKTAGPKVKIGNAQLVQAPGAPERVATFSAEGDGDVTLNFVNANVREVVDAVLGQILHLNYTIDPKVQATITMQTSRPMKRDAVLPTLENVLQASAIALVRADDVYRVVPLAGAARSGGMPSSVAQGQAGSAGYGLQIIPLKYASAEHLQKVLEPFVPSGGVLQIDDARNLLLVSGTQRDVDSFLKLVNIFDVDWLSGMSYGLFALQQGAAGSVAQELNMILSSGKNGPLAGIVRIVPIERINSILLVSSQPSYIQRAQEWIQRLDEGSDESAPRLYVYYVQNSRSSDLAKVLSQMFGGSVVKTVTPTVTPGASLARIGSDLPMLGGGASSGSSGSSRPSPVIGGTQSQPQDQAPDAQANATITSDSAGGGLPSLPPPVNVGEVSTRTPQASSGVQIVADEKNNALVIMSRPREYRMIDAALKKLDILPQQVLIEATVAEVTLNDGLQYGLQWFFKQGGSNFTLSSLASGAINPVFPGFDWALGGGSAKAVLNALSQVTKVNVVSAPQLMVLDHQTAMLQVGDEVPIATQQATSVSTPGAPVVNSIEMRSTGVILKVTPRVNANGIATLEIEQEVSDVAKTTTSTLDSPTIQQRRIRSVVSVGNGETIALGGLIRQNKSRTRSGLPILSDIPILGALTSQTNDTVQRTELLILLTPTIVRNIEEARSVTDELRKRLHSVLPVAPARKM
jgi:general secretion pathway protein D